MTIALASEMCSIDDEVMKYYRIIADTNQPLPIPALIQQARMEVLMREVAQLRLELRALKEQRR